MGYSQNIVTVVNRTTRPLDVTDDGRPYVIPPGYMVVPDIDEDTGAQRVKVEKGPDGKKIEVPQFKVVGAAKPDRDGNQAPSHDGRPYGHPMIVGAAVRARRQHILRGSQDPTNPQFAETLVAITEIDDPTDHQEQREGELLDRSLLPKDRQTVEVVRNAHHISKERRRSLVDARLSNIAGLRMDY